MRGWLFLIAVLFVGFGVWVKSAGFVLFGVMLFILGILATVAMRAASSLGEGED